MGKMKRHPRVAALVYSCGHIELLYLRAEHSGTALVYEAIGTLACSRCQGRTHQPYWPRRVRWRDGKLWRSEEKPCR